MQVGLAFCCGSTPTLPDPGLEGVLEMITWSEDSQVEQGFRPVCICSKIDVNGGTLFADGLGNEIEEPDP
jgi:hypothetical protein